MCEEQLMIKCPLYPFHCGGEKDNCYIESKIGEDVKMENIENEQELETKSEEIKKGAKDYSLFAQIISAIWIGGWNSFQFAKIIVTGNSISVIDIIISGLAIAGCFAPVYVSIVLDKIKEIKNLK